jgi:hypothetical protein
MAQRSDISKPSGEGSLQATEALERQNHVPLKRSWGAFVLANVEAVCHFVVYQGGNGIPLSKISASVTGWVTVLHRDIFRIPALLLAIVGSMLNLWILWRSHHLRNAPSAAWRKRPLTAKDRWRIGLVLTLSALTLFTAGFEIYFHRLTHHSFM